MMLKVYIDRQQVGEVETVKDFLDRYYKRDRYTGRGEDYAAVLVKSHGDDLQKNGYDLISHHDSKIGEMVYLIGDRFPSWWVDMESVICAA